MVKSDREYRITRAQAARFVQAIERLEMSPAEPTLDPLLAKAEKDALRSQLEELQEQLAEYETLRSAVISTSGPGKVNSGRSRR